MTPILAIDPGSKGFLTLRTDGGMIYYAISDGDMLELALKIKSFRDAYPDLRAVMEQVHAVFGSSAKGTFAFGEIYGYIKGVLTTLQVPYTLVPPTKWQKEIWIAQDKAGNTKQTSYNACRRLFPDIDLRRSVKCKKWDDNKVDSILICEYARRKNL